MFVEVLMFIEVLMFRSIAEKGPSTEEKVASIEATMATYEAKISGLGTKLVLSFYHLHTSYVVSKM